MRSLASVLPAVACALALAACGGGNSTPVASMPAAGAPAQSLPAHVAPDNNGKFSQGTLPIPSVTESVPCTGGLDLTFGGSMNYRAHTVPQHGGSKVAVHTTLDGVTATDSAGNAYTFKGVGNAQVVVPQNGQLHGVGVGNMVAVGSGPDAGVRGHVKVSIGLDPYGNVVLTFTTIHIICR